MGIGLRKRAARLALYLLVTAATLVASLVSYLYIGALRSRPQLEGGLILPMLSSAVTIRRDINGMPLIEAVDLDDAVFVLGFLHAQERFFQMDLSRKKAAGELASLLGSSALESDRAARLHRFRARARVFLERMPEEQRNVLRRYTAGVNVGLENLDAKPFEYALLFASPAAWREEDTLLVNMAMYMLLQQQDGPHPEIVRQTLIRHYDVEFADFIQSTRSEWDDPMSRDDETALTAGLPRMMSKVQAIASSVAPMPEHRLRLATQAQEVIGSNSWAVSGRRGEGQRAILANDMHLPLSQPNVFFRVAIRLGDSSPVIAGITVPGMPMLAAGSNGRIAWGLTNANGDWSDLVRIPKKGKQPPVSTYRETISLRGGDAINIDVRETVHGPIVDEDADAVYALQWVAHRAEGHTLGLWPLLQIAGTDEALKVAAEAGMPHMNFLVVDTTGKAAWTIAGRIPRRGAVDGTEPAASETGWGGWLPPAEYPVESTDDRDFLWTANNRVVGGESWRSIGLGSEFALGVRAKRIHQRLLRIDSPDVSDMFALQLDDAAPLMRRWHRLLTDLVDGMKDSPEKRELTGVLSAWDGRASADSAAYRVVRRFRDEVAEEVMPAVLAELLSREPELAWYQVAPNWETPLWRIVSSRPTSLLPADQPNWGAYLQGVLLQKVYASYKSTYDGDLSRAVWGDANVVHIRHPLSESVPLIGRWLDMPQAAMSGDSNVVLAQSKSFGPVMRLVVTPGREEEGVLAMSAGVAGNPLTPYYGKGHDQWQAGKPTPLLPGEPHYTLTLAPSADSQSTE